MFHLGRFLATSRGRNISFLLVGTAMFHVTVYLASPFFTPFMLDVLALDYIEFTIAIGVQAGIKVMSMPYWGRLVDRFGARRSYAAAIMLAAVVPLPWLFVGGTLGVYAAQMFSGLAWSAHEVTLYALVLESSRRSNRPLLYALQGLCNAVGQVGGSMFGGALIGATSYWTVFFVSLLGRCVVAILLPMQIRELRSRPSQGREPLVLRIIGYRPGAGVTHRPVFPRSVGHGRGRGSEGGEGG
jgi:MFS family permease